MIKDNNSITYHAWPLGLRSPVLAWAVSSLGSSVHQHLEEEEEERGMKMFHCFPLSPPVAIEPIKRPKAGTAVRSWSLRSVSSKVTNVYRFLQFWNSLGPKRREAWITHGLSFHFFRRFLSIVCLWCCEGDQCGSLRMRRGTIFFSRVKQTTVD